MSPFYWLIQKEVLLSCRQSSLKQSTQHMHDEQATVRWRHPKVDDGNRQGIFPHNLLMEMDSLWSFRAQSIWWNFSLSIPPFQIAGLPNNWPSSWGCLNPMPHSIQVWLTQVSVKRSIPLVSYLMCSNLTAVTGQLRLWSAFMWGSHRTALRSG